MAEKGKKGFVYIMTNPSFYKDWVKIGYTDNLECRRHDLSHTTAIPLPFELYAYAKTAKYQELERTLHKMIEHVSTELDENNNLRINPNKEFFNITPEHAYNLLCDIAPVMEDVEITKMPKADEDSKVVSVTNDMTQDERKVRDEWRNKNNTFALFSISNGSKIVFAQNNAIIATTVDGVNRIRLSNGTVYTITQATKFVCDKFNLWGENRKTHSCDGWKNWMYNGEILFHIRERMIKEQIEKMVTE